MCSSFGACLRSCLQPTATCRATMDAINNQFARDAAAERDAAAGAAGSEAITPVRLL